MASQVPGEDSPQTTRSSEELLDKIQQWNLDNSNREIVIVVGGKSGTGKSTLINNFLSLDGSKAAEASIQPNSVTHNVKVYKGEVNGVLVRAVDMPGLHARRHNRDKEKDVVAALSHHTNSKADILIYCVSLTQRLDSIDERNIATLNRAFGKKLWESTILVLTHADSVLEDEDNADNLDKIVREFTKELEEILTDCADVKASVKPFSSCHTSESSNPNPSPATEVAPDPSPETEVVPDPSVATEHEDDEAATAPDTESEELLPVEIVAIPTGKKPNKPPGWRESLLAQIIALCQNKTTSYLTQLEGIALEKIFKKLKKGAKVGAVAGAIGGASGAAIGTGIGAAVGGVIGGILTAPLGGIGAVPTAAGGAAVGALLGSLFGGGGAGVVALLTGGLATAHNENLFKEIVFYYKVRKKLEELQEKGLSESFFLSKTWKSFLTACYNNIVYM